MHKLLLAFLFFGCFDEDESASPPPFLGWGNDKDGGSGTTADPNSDADNDGFTYAEEEEAGTNPNYEYSRPYEGDYNVGFCDTPPEPTGPTGEGRFEDRDGTVYTWPSLGIGDVPENMTLIDQYGEEVDLYSFCGKHVMIVVSAGWCGPCRSFAGSAQDIQDEYRDDNLQLVTLITNTNQQGVAPDQEFLQSWADQYALEDIPVLAVPEWDRTDYDHPQFWYDKDAGIPSIYHLNDKLEVVSDDNGVYDPSSWL